MKVVVVDDHLMFAEMVSRVCYDYGLEVVAKVATGEEAILAIQQSKSDLLVIDLNLPNLDGFGTARVARTLVSRIRLLAISSRVDQNTAYRLEQEQFDGFVAKEAGLADLRLALDAVISGGRFFSKPLLAEKLTLKRSPSAFT